MKRDRTGLKPLRDLASQVSINAAKLKSPETFGVTNEWQSPPCFWDCIAQDGITPGAADWETEFYPDSTTYSITSRVLFREATAGGELTLTHFNGSNSYAARFAKLIVHAEQPMTIPCYAGFVGASGDIQRKVNGTIYAMAGPADFNFDIELIPGYNFISFATDVQVDGFQFRGLLFDGELVQWVHPKAARNPVRQGYIDSSGGSGSSSGASGTSMPESS